MGPRATLRLCAPRLSPDEVRLLRRGEPHAWTVSDLPLLDGGRLQEAAGTRARPAASAATTRRQAQQEQMAEVVGRADHQRRLQDAARDVDAAPRRPAREVGGRRAPCRAPTRSLLSRTVAPHESVDRRGPGADPTRSGGCCCSAAPSRSLGHRRRPHPGPARVHGVLAASSKISEQVAIASLSINYRGPARGSSPRGQAGRHPRRQRADLPYDTAACPSCTPQRTSTTRSSDTWLDEHAEHIACVIGDPRRIFPYPVTPRRTGEGPGVQPRRARRPRRAATAVEGAVDHYVAIAGRPLATS